MNESEVKRQLELLDLMNQAELREKFWVLSQIL